MKEFWDERYAEPDYVYGKAPNKYFKEKLDEIQLGEILFPAEGEGRSGQAQEKEKFEAVTRISLFSLSTSSFWVFRAHAPCSPRGGGGKPGGRRENAAPIRVAVRVGEGLGYHGIRGPLAGMGTDWLLVA